MSNQIIPPRRIRGIRDTLPPGYILGRSSKGNGKAELIPIAKLATAALATGIVGPPNQVAPTNPTWFGLTLIKPTVATFTQVNPGTASFTDTVPGVFATDTATGGLNLRLLTVAAPSTPYSFVAGVSMIFPSGNGGFGIGWYDGTNKIADMSWQGNPDFGINSWNSPTSFNGSPVGNIPSYVGSIMFFKIRDDGTNVTFSYGIDGTNFNQFYTVAKASGFLGASGYSKPCILLDPRSNTNMPPNFTLFHWKQGH